MFDVNIEAIPLSTVIAVGVIALLLLRILLGSLLNLLDRILLG